MTRRGAARENLDGDHAAAAARAEIGWSCRLVGMDRTGIGIVVLRHCDGEQLAGAREPRASGPASESRQRTNPRAMVRGGRRAVSYGDLAEAEGAWEGARWVCARALLRLEAGRGLG